MYKIGDRVTIIGNLHKGHTGVIIEIDNPILNLYYYVAVTSLPKTMFGYKVILCEPKDITPLSTKGLWKLFRKPKSRLTSKKR